MLGLNCQNKPNGFSSCCVLRGGAEIDNIHTFFFFAVLVANFEFAGFAPKQKYTDWTSSMETVRTEKF